MSESMAMVMTSIRADTTAKGQLVQLQKLEWKQTHARTDTTDCSTLSTSAAGNYCVE